MSDFWQETTATAERFRQELHQHPELAWQERDTATRIRTRLTELSIPWRPCAETGTVAVLNGDANNRAHIALRGDMDALPIIEKTAKPYASLNPGCMHACGHDGHTATLLGAAQWLKHYENQLPGPVSLIFQPAEEGGHGALKMIQDGALDGIDEIYGWHNWPAIEFGKMLCPDGLVMCGNGVFKITLHGQGGHSSQPELCRDPVLAASATHLALQQIVSRRLAPQDSVVVAVTSIDARSSATVVPEFAELSGSYRVPNEQIREQVHQLIESICLATAQTYGVECDVQIEPRYQATINHPTQAKTMRTVWQQTFGAEAVLPLASPPLMASEDFSYYLQHIPGAFALIGADDGAGHNSPCHSAYYDFNDRLIPRVMQLFSALAGVSLPSL